LSWKRVRYLQRTGGCGQATLDQFNRARSFFDGFYTPVTALWMESERIQDLLRLLETRGLSAGGDGKGRSCWMAYGYLLAKRDCDVIALHDCDIVNYDRQLLARLCYPVAHPHLSFEFCKGYYARVTDRLHGRVTRLFVTPLIRALEGMAPGAPFLKYLDSFRYPLAGEFAMDINLARANRIPSDWGLEVGTLAEVYRDCAVSRTCQVDLMERRAQPRSPGDPSRPDTHGGRHCKSLFRTLAAEGLYSPGRFSQLEVRVSAWRRIPAPGTPMPC
jgi:glucosyl-3-phosphoglycerate synthase